MRGSRKDGTEYMIQMGLYKALSKLKGAPGTYKKVFLSYKKLLLSSPDSQCLNFVNLLGSIFNFLGEVRVHVPYFPGSTCCQQESWSRKEKLDMVVLWKPFLLKNLTIQLPQGCRPPGCKLSLLIWVPGAARPKPKNASFVKKFEPGLLGSDNDFKVRLKWDCEWA